MVAFYNYILPYFAAFWWHKNPAISTTEVSILFSNY